MVDVGEKKGKRRGKRGKQKQRRVGTAVYYFRSLAARARHQALGGGKRKGLGKKEEEKKKITAHRGANSDLQCSCFCCFESQPYQRCLAEKRKKGNLIEKQGREKRRGARTVLCRDA